MSSDHPKPVATLEQRKFLLLTAGLVKDAVEEFVHDPELTGEQAEAQQGRLDSVIHADLNRKGICNQIGAWITASTIEAQLGTGDLTRERAEELKKMAAELTEWLEDFAA